MNLAISIENLHKIYSDGFHAVNGVDLSIQEGDFFALLGRNGAGKSTIIGIISSLVRKTQGEVKVFGKDIEHETTNVKRTLGIVPQEFNFNQFETVYNIVMNQAGYYGLSKSEACCFAKKYLKKLDLWNKRNVSPRMLSGGMKRRLMIARALMHQPKVLILDEPTAGVDIELRRSLWDFVKEINQQGVTIILTTHYLEEAEQLCKNIAIIDHGKIIENTSMKELLKKRRKETLVIDVKDPLQNMPTLNGYKINEYNPYSIEVEAEKMQGFNQLFSQLTAQNISVLSLRNKQNRLENLFVDITSN